MTQDAYWDDLGLAWTAVTPDLQIAPRLKERLRRQSLLSAAMFFAGLPLSLAGIALGAWTIWQGTEAEAWFFVTRGIAIVIISLLSGIAAWSFRNVWNDDTQSLAAKIGLALARARHWHMALRLGCIAVSVAALFGTVGYEIRIAAGKPPALSLAEPLILLALVGLVLFLLQRRAKDDIAKYSYLRTLLTRD